MNVTTKSEFGTGQSFQTEQKVIIVHDGARGAVGGQGDKGDKGDQGDSIVIRGAWVGSATYCPLDAVTARSTASPGIYSLFIQRSDAACAASVVEPYLEPARWDEVGATDLSNVTGSIWEIYQLNHEFSMVGTPVAFSHQSASWVKADALMADELAVAVVREVIDSDRALLQSTGEVPYIDPGVIFPDGSDWDPGRVYYVSQVRGRVELTAPVDPSSYSQPILVPTRYHEATLPDPGSGAKVGVVLPWTPLGGTTEPDNRIVGFDRFTYADTAAGTQTLVGPDDNGDTLSYTPGDPNLMVFQDGLLLPEADYAAADGSSVVLSTPTIAVSSFEILASAEPLDIVVPSTQAKLDSIASGFNGTATSFPLAIATSPVQTTEMNLLLWLDGIGQEPLVDYTVLDDPSNPGFSVVAFTHAPEEGTRFWGTVFIPVSAP